MVNLGKLTTATFKDWTQRVLVIGDGAATMEVPADDPLVLANLATAKISPAAATTIIFQPVWLDAASTQLQWTLNGATATVPSNLTAAAVAAIAAAGLTIAPYVAPPPAPVQFISDRQFFQQLSVAGKITQDEALAYVGGGTLPSAMANLISQLSPANQFSAKMLIIGATSFDRQNPLVAQIGTLYGMASADLDALWAAAALL